jgi:tRNA-2-methylthio-N6-dimethylallyladenosine synthase
MEGSRYFLVTYGCQKNEYDSEVIAAIMEGMGFACADSPDDALVVVLNTCCVRDNADQKVYGRLWQYKSLKDNNPAMKIVVTGCLAQKDSVRLAARFPHVDVVLGTHNLDRLEEALRATFLRAGQFLCCDLDDINFEGLPIKRRSAFSAWVPVSEGCDCHCTFCIVPRVRGKLSSRNPSRIVEEIERFVAAGGKEVTLLGQNVNSYGKDMKGDHPDFGELLRSVNAIEGLRRIRFTSPHPRNFDLRLIEAMRDSGKMCQHIHLPLQSGDDSVLRRMGRSYTSLQYRELVASLRKHIPDIALTTDIIVGFPGETEEHFERTMTVIEELQFDGAFMFAYSEREGTAAAKMKDSIPIEERMRRLHFLVERQNDISRTRNQACEGRVEEVLVEGISKKKSHVLTGRSRKNKVVNFEGKADLIGEMLEVKLKKAYTWGFMGEQLQ